MRSLWNPNRFMRSVQPWYWGNIQPGRVRQRRIQAILFNTIKPRRKIIARKMFIPRSSGLLRR